MTGGSPRRSRPALLALGAALAAALAGCQTVPPAPEPAAAPRTTNKLADLQTQLGIGYLREGKLELAWKRLHSALEHDPDYSTAHNAMGLLYERLGEPDQAEEHFRRAVESNPTDSAAQNNYGRFLCRQGRYEEGMERLLRALKNPLYETPEVANANAGLCAKAAGDAQAAETHFRAALERNPKLAAALLNMADLSYEQGRYLSARGYLQRYLEVGPRTAHALWLGVRIERALGDRDAASSYALLLRSTYPDSNEARLLQESSTQ